VDDDPDMRAMLEETLDYSDMFQCAGCHATAEEALAMIPRQNPRLVLMDVRLPGMDGVECSRLLKRKMPRLKVVLMTGFLDRPNLDRVAQSLIEGTLFKPFVPGACLTELKLALTRTVTQHSEQTVAKSTPTGGTKEPNDNGADLSPLENQVMECFARGRLYKETADDLHLSQTAVRKHQHGAYGRLGATIKVEAVTRWRERAAAAASSLASR
jgi:DNA-binding NarL/FixJ family response regulator